MMLHRRTSAIEDERALLSRASRWLKYPRLGDLTADALRRICSDEGIDFATAVLFDRIVRSREHGPFIERVESLRAATTRKLLPLNATFAIAPGAFYMEIPQTGGDGREFRANAARIGCRTEVIPTYSIGTLAQNGRVICDWLTRQSAEKIIVTSLSKGGADVKMALAEPDAPRAFRNVVAWINIGGILCGTPVITWLRSRTLLTLFFRFRFWLRGHDFRFFYDLDRGPGCTLDFPMQFPEHLKVIHVVGFPLVRHLSNRRSRRWHRRLSALGPNDAFLMLSDICTLRGQLFPIWGADHYFKPPSNPESLVAALLQYLGEELNLFDAAKPVEMVSK